MPRLLAKLFRHPNDEPSDLEIDSAANDAFVAQLNASLASGAGSRSAANIFPVILELALTNLRDLVKQAGGIDQAIAIAQKAYNDFVAPIDIPGIPNFVEPAFDRAMVYAVGVLMRTAWERIKGTLVADVPTPANPSPAVGDVGPA